MDRWPEHVDFVEGSVDATDIPSDIDGDMVTVVTALHHFPPSMVEGIISEVARRGSSLFVAEGFPRDLLRASAYIPALVAGASVNPFVCERRRVGKMLITYAFPVLAATGMWDWLVSALRVYQPDELIEMGRRVAPGYRWTKGEASIMTWGRATYVFGRPRETESARSEDSRSV